VGFSICSGKTPTHSLSMDKFKDFAAAFSPFYIPMVAAVALGRGAKNYLASKYPVTSTTTITEENGSTSSTKETNK
jgi:hypothetical protein